MLYESSYNVILCLEKLGWILFLVVFSIPIFYGVLWRGSSDCR